MANSCISIGIGFSMCYVRVIFAFLPFNVKFSQNSDSEQAFSGMSKQNYNVKLVQGRIVLLPFFAGFPLNSR